MAREYFIRRKEMFGGVIPPKSDYEWWEEPNLISLAKTVYEEEQLFDTGIMDEAGDKIMAKEKKDAIGFVRFKDKT